VIATKLLEPMEEDSFTRFVKPYVAGTNVSEAARQIGLTREHVSRELKGRLVKTICDVIRRQKGQNGNRNRRLWFWCGARQRVV